MAINFELRSVSTKKNATSNLRCVVREHGINVKFPTDIEVNVHEYHKAFRKGASKQARNNYDASVEGTKVAAQKTTAKEQIIAAIADGLTSAHDIAERVRKALVLDDARAKAKEAEKLQTSCVLPYMDNFIEKMTKGEIKTAKKKNFDESTQNYYRNMRRYLGAYLNNNADLTFNDFTQDIADGFIAWLERHNIMVSTQKNILACVAAVTRRAWLAGLIDPSKVGVIDLWKMPTPDENEVRAEVALSQNEVDALWELSNNGTLNHVDQMVVDMTLAGIYSMQRFSDYSRFSKDMVISLDGRKFLHFLQDKTGVLVDVPLIGRLDKVMARNDYDFTMLDPKTKKWVSKVNYQTFGKHLRNILHDLSVNVPSLRDMEVTNLTHNEISMEDNFKSLLALKAKGKIKTASNEYYTLMRDTKIQIANGCMGTSYLWKRNAHGEVIKEKWSLVNSHVCRRTGITLALEQGILTDEQIRKISGHKTLKSFRKYDKRDAKKQNMNIFDALLRAEEKPQTKVLNMAVNQ